MSDPKQTLSTAEVVESGLDDWRQLLGVIRARYRTGDFATGLALVDRVGALAEAADHHPDITLTYPEVVISMSSHDVDGITSRDIDLAREISAVDPTLPPPPVEQRWHLDVWVPHDDVERRLQAVLDAGGRLISDAAAPSFWVVEDTDGNRSCICTSTGR